MNGDKPECELIGGDGNIYAIMGAVRRTLKRAGQADKAAEFSERVKQAHSYDEALAIVQEYVEPVEIGGVE